jgi:hypothetical protein
VERGVDLVPNGADVGRWQRSARSGLRALGEELSERAWGSRLPLTQSRRPGLPAAAVAAHGGRGTNWRRCGPRRVGPRDGGSAVCQAAGAGFGPAPAPLLGAQAHWPRGCARSHPRRPYGRVTLRQGRGGCL